MLLIFLMLFSDWNRLVDGLKNTRVLHLQRFEELGMQFPVLNQAIHLRSSLPFWMENHHLPQNKEICIIIILGALCVWPHMKILLLH